MSGAPLKILLLASELAPLVSTGGLADAVGGLARALKAAGHDVRVAIPGYRALQQSSVLFVKGRKSCSVELAGTTYKGLLRVANLGGVPVYALEQEELFGRPYLYGPPGGDYSDNARRFAFFCRGVLELLCKIDFRPDVIHCHDWQTALLPYLLRHELAESPFFQGTATLLTIHNLAYQGVFPAAALADLGLDQAHLDLERLEFYGQLNLLKGGVQTADLLTTVSPGYCREILSPASGSGLDGVLCRRGDDLFGILNGIDTCAWDPATDPHLAKGYSAERLAGRERCRQALRRDLGLPEDPALPVCGMVARLTEQKGVALLLEVLPWLLGQGVPVVILGDGDPTYEAALREVAARSPLLRLATVFAPPLARRIFAGCDLFLMPSRFEPCGLAQLLAMRYGAVPVARRTGGLADTVIDPLDDLSRANGFLFDAYTAAAFQEALERALEAWRDQPAWRRLQRQGMRAEHGWERPAAEYIDLYRQARARKVLLET